MLEPKLEAQGLVCISREYFLAMSPTFTREEHRFLIMALAGIKDSDHILLRDSAELRKVLHWQPGKEELDGGKEEDAALGL